MRFGDSFEVAYDLMLGGLTLGALFASDVPLAAKVGLTAAFFLILNVAMKLEFSLLDAAKLHFEHMLRGLVYLDSDRAGRGELQKVLNEVSVGQGMFDDSGRAKMLVLIGWNFLLLLAGLLVSFLIRTLL